MDDVVHLQGSPLSLGLVVMEVQGVSYVIEGVSRACGTLDAVTVASQRWPRRK